MAQIAMILSGLEDPLLFETFWLPHLRKYSTINLMCLLVRRRARP